MMVLWLYIYQTYENAYINYVQMFAVNLHQSQKLPQRKHTKE